MGPDDFTHLDGLFPGHVESLDPNAGVGYEIIGDLHQGLEEVQQYQMDFNYPRVWYFQTN